MVLPLQCGLPLLCLCQHRGQFGDNVGCQKGGTTTLYDLICRHPRIRAARQKEIQFFSLHYDRGPDWYRSQFPRTWRAISGEASPYYLFHPLAAARIAEHCPDVRLIVLLRDPVQRTLSQYFHSRRLGLEELPFADALAAEPDRLADADAVLAAGGHHAGHREHSYLSRSRYGPQLKRFAQWFPHEQLLVLRSEEFFAEPERITSAVWVHLGLVATDVGPVRVLNRGAGEAVGVSRSDARRLEDLLAGERSVVEAWVRSHGIATHRRAADAVGRAPAAGPALDRAEP